MSRALRVGGDAAPDEPQNRTVEDRQAGRILDELVVLDLDAILQVAERSLGSPHACPATGIADVREFAPRRNGEKGEVIGLVAEAIRK